MRYILVQLKGQGMRDEGQVKQEMEIGKTKIRKKFYKSEL
jgi:hypothetical protein